MRTPDPNAREKQRPPPKPSAIPWRSRASRRTSRTRRKPGSSSSTSADAAGPCGSAWDELEPVHEPPPPRCPPGRDARPRHGDRRRRGNHRRGQPRSGLRIGGRRRARRHLRRAAARRLAGAGPALPRKGEGDDCNVSKPPSSFRASAANNPPTSPRWRKRLSASGGWPTRSASGWSLSIPLNPLMVLPEGQGVRIVDIVMQARPSGDSPSQAPSVTLEK